MSLSKGAMLQALDSDSLDFEGLKAVLVEIISRLPDEDHDGFNEEDAAKAWRQRPFQEGTDRQGGGGIIV